jgi:cyclopropane-fatty-acyl-phospholipid synthase
VTTAPTRADVAALGTSPAAIARHYDLSDEFFALWLGPEMIYSCALWADVPTDTLARAQARKVDWFARELGVGGGRVLDAGCGWGGAANRLVAHHGAASVTGISLSAAQIERAQRAAEANATFRLESWVDHEPDDEYDAVLCVEASEHFARDGLTSEDKVVAYRAFFERSASWLRPGGRLGLQAICLDNAGPGESVAPGSITDLVRRHIFPESMSSSLSELAIGWETDFRLESFVVHPEHYVRTFRAWTGALIARRTEAEDLVGPETCGIFARYFAASQALFRLRQQSLYRIVLSRRPEPKRWVVPPHPVAEGADEPAVGASRDAVQAHYDLSNDFYATWLGPTMSYSSGLWDSTADPDDAQRAKVDFFATELGVGSGSRVLDVGCGWGSQLRGLVERHGLGHAVGLTLSEAQSEWLRERPIPGTEVRVETWRDHDPGAAYDAIVTYGAFEHFARDGSTSDERVGAYRAFFARCFGWLPPGGRLGLETIAHDDAPDTAAPLGRGPLGDFVLDLYPESISPHLCELVLGFEPYFLVRVLRSDAGDFARTCRGWLRGLTDHSAACRDLVGEDTYRRFKTYLAASEVQFRMRTITNYRVVLERRPAVRR